MSLTNLYCRLPIHPFPGNSLEVGLFQQHKNQAGNENNTTTAAMPSGNELITAFGGL